MTVLLNSAEACPVGVTPTVSNTSGGSEAALNNINIGSGSLLVASTAQHAHGAQSFVVTPAASGVDYVGWLPSISAASYVSRAYFYFTSAPSAAFSIMQLRSSSSQVATVIYNTSGKLSVNDAGGNSVWLSTAAISLNTWIRVELAATVGSTTSNGTIKAQYATLDSGATDGFTTGTANQNAGSSNINEFRAGRLTGTYTTAFYIDDMAVQDSTITYIGAAGNTAPGAPTSVSAATGVLSATATWTAPGSNGGSAITGYIITASPGGQFGTAGSGATTGSVTGLVAGTSYTLTVQATNAIGTGISSTASNAVTPTAAGQTVAPISDVTTTGWTSSDSSSPLALDLDEAVPNDLDYVTSPTTPSGSTFEVKFAAPATPADANGWAIQARLRYRNASSGTATIALYQGTTAIATSGTLTLTSSFQTFTLSVTSGQAASITNLADLRIRTVVTAS